MAAEFKVGDHIELPRDRDAERGNKRRRAEIGALQGELVTEKAVEIAVRARHQPGARECDPGVRTPEEKTYRAVRRRGSLRLARWKIVGVRKCRYRPKGDDEGPRENRSQHGNSPPASVDLFCEIREGSRDGEKSRAPARPVRCA